MNIINPKKFENFKHEVNQNGNRIGVKNFFKHPLLSINYKYGNQIELVAEIVKHPILAYQFYAALKTPLETNEIVISRVTAMDQKTGNTTKYEEVYRKDSHDFVIRYTD